MHDNRLDYISNIDKGCIDKMTNIRGMFMALDELIGMQGDKMSSAAGCRAVSLSRTHLEISLQFAIKALCILGEIKPKD
jgi:hypothetical protein